MPTTVYGGIIFPNIRSTTLTLTGQAVCLNISPDAILTTCRSGGTRTHRNQILILARMPIPPRSHFFVKMDKLYLHFTQCFSLTYHQQHRIGCFLTLLSTTLLVVTLPPLTRFIFILICTWIGFSYVTPRTTFLPFYEHCFIGTISKTSIDFLP